MSSNTAIPKLDQLSLYETRYCPYCIYVRHAIDKLGIQIESRDTHKAEHWQALQAGGGRTTVPCLRIDHADGTEWMYESQLIVRYLVTHFAQDINGNKE